MGPIINLNLWKNRETFSPIKNGTRDRPARRPVTVPTELSRLRHVFLSPLESTFIEDASFFQAKNRQIPTKFYDRMPHYDGNKHTSDFILSMPLATQTQLPLQDTRILT